MGLQLITDVLEDVKTSSSGKSKPTITVCKSLGQVRFSNVTAEMMGIKVGSFLDIYVDRVDNTIGFEVVKDKKDHTATVLGQTVAKSKIPLLKIEIRKFLEYFKIEKETATKYKIKKNDDGIFVCNLNEDRVVVRKRAKKQKEEVVVAD